MTTITFDKLRYLETLKASGIPEAQARSHAVALDDALRDSVATKADIETVKLAMAEFKAEMVKWMFSGFITIVGLLVAILMKFPV